MSPLAIHLGRTIHPIQFFSSPSNFKPEQQVVIQGLSTDTRTLQKGDWFIAIKGQKFNGVCFLKDALMKGISGAIVNDEDVKRIPISYKNITIPIITVSDSIKAYGALANAYLSQLTAGGGKKIAITGSAGKTTCKDFLSHLLSSEFKIFTSQYNFNNHIGIPKNIFQIEEPLMGEKYFDFYIFELAMNHSGEIDYLSSLIKPDYTVITNILPAHIGFFESLKEIALAKSEIFNHQNPLGVVYIPEEEPFFSLLKKRAKENNLKNIQAVNTHFLSIKSHFTKKGKFFHYLKTNFEGLNDISIKCMGKHQEKNLALTVKIGLDLGLSISSLKKAIPSLKPTDSRFEIAHHCPLVIDDTYNANPTSMIEAVEWCLQLGLENTYIVLGDVLELGEKEKFYHQQIGEKIANLTENNNKVQFIFIGKAMQNTAKNLNRTLKSLASEKIVNFHHFENKEKAIPYLKKTMDKDNFYFFKGSNGMKLQHLIKEFLCFTT